MDFAEATCASDLTLQTRIQIKKWKQLLDASNYFLNAIEWNILQAV